MHILLVIAVLLFSAATHAEGWVTREGHNSLGQHIVWDMQDELRKPTTENGNHHYVWATVYVNVKGRTIKTYERQACETTLFPKLSLACDQAGSSPLAGTRYVGKEVNGKCEKGEPFVRYRCVAGCENNPRAPKLLDQGYWECD